MLIDINLLPAKRKKNIPLFVWLLTGAAVLAAGLALFAAVHIKQEQVERAEKELAAQQQLREALEQAAQNASSGTQTSADRLQQAAEWSQTRRLPASPILEHLVSLLPERGFFQAMSYVSDEAMNLTVQFDTSREGAYYLAELKDSEWVERASILQVDTSVDETEEEAKQILELTDGLPRYLVQYEIVFNRQAVLQKVEEAKK
jgi:type IV pilus assembly protein PilN